MGVPLKDEIIQWADDHGFEYKGIVEFAFWQFALCMTHKYLKDCVIIAHAYSNFEDTPENIEGAMQRLYRWTQNNLHFTPFDFTTYYVDDAEEADHLNPKLMEIHAALDSLQELYRDVGAILFEDEVKTWEEHNDIGFLMSALGIDFEYTPADEEFEPQENECSICGADMSFQPPEMTCMINGHVTHTFCRDRN
jgi:hypothetical protein